jgi:hypothetical protein
VNFPPLPDRDPPWPGVAPLDTACADLVPWWLHVRCECRTLSYIPLRLLSAKAGWDKLLAEVLPRLRCERCSARPSSIDLVDDPANRGSGRAGSKQLRLHLI